MIKNTVVIGSLLLFSLGLFASPVLAVNNHVAELSIAADGLSFTWDGPPGLSHYTITYCDGTSDPKVDMPGGTPDDSTITTTSEIYYVNAKGGQQVEDAYRECTPETDVCPNIDGPQGTMPDGYILDAQGNCVSEIIDVCPNIDGVQSTLPQGYHFEGENCVLDQIGTPDLCENLDGIQAEVPAGYLLDSEGNCIAEEIKDEEPDVCINLEGVQTDVPSGYTQDEGVCEPIEDDGDTKDAPGQPTTPSRSGGQVLATTTNLPNTGGNNLVIVFALIVSGLALRIVNQKAEKFVEARSK